jgi:RNA polymerase sigma-70 factor (ECF subfamily)
MLLVESLTVMSDTAFEVPAEVPQDGALVLGAQRGEREAREELARRYRRPAFLFAYQLLGNREDAMDVAQDSLLKFFNTLDRFDSRRPVQPWLFRIVRNRAVDIARRKKIRRAESLDDPEKSFEPATRPEASPERQAVRRQLQERVWQEVHSLPEKQREILVLREYQDLSYAEIADILRIPKGTVMSRLHGARKALRSAVAEALGGNDG